MSEPKIFGVIALKGGVGKTTVVANLGASLTKNYKKKVLLIDANFSTPHLGLHIGLVSPKYTLHHALNENHSIFETIYQHELGFHVIPGKLAPFGTNPLILKEKLAPLKEIYDVILIDSSPSLNEEMYSTMAASDELLVVSSPDYPTLSSTIHAIVVAQEKEAKIRGIVINKTRKKKFELSSRDISNASEVKVLASIPDNIQVLSSLAKMTPIVAHAPKHEISLIYKKLAGSLIGEKFQNKSKNKIIKQKELTC